MPGIGDAEITTTTASDERQSAWRTAMFGGLLGAIVFLALGGGHILNPWSVGWLLDSPDPRTHYLGWTFYRNDSWHWPLGLNQTYGMAMGSSVVYSDSIPLLALLFKAMAPLLHGSVQYTGIWLLLCMIMQGAGAMLVADRLGAARVSQFLAAGLLMFPPILLQRLAGHYALVGQWTILWAIWMYLRPGRARSPNVREVQPSEALDSREDCSTPCTTPLCAPTSRTFGERALLWAVLAVIASLVHLYLAVMVLAVWVADLTQGRRAMAALFREVGFVLGTTFLAMWMAGYFVLGFGDVRTAGAAGAYSMNLLSPINSLGMSLFLPELPMQRAGQMEGSCYLGLGIMGLLLVAVCLKWQEVEHLRRRCGMSTSSGRFDGTSSVNEQRGAERFRWWPIGLVAVAMVIFAISPVITFGPTILLKLPNFYGPLLEALRATGRMTWLGFYVLVVAALAAVIGRLGRRQAAVVLAVVLATQVVDLWPGLMKTRAHLLAADQWTNPMRDAFWEAAGQRYKRVVLVPAEDPSAITGTYVPVALDWFALGKWASDHGMSINYGYFARYSWDARVKADEQNRAALEAGTPDPETLYILTDSRQYDAIPGTAWQGAVDGLRIIAPGLQR